MIKFYRKKDIKQTVCIFVLREKLMDILSDPFLMNALRKVEKKTLLKWAKGMFLGLGLEN